MDVIDYEIWGSETQFVEIELDPTEAAVGESGSMMMMSEGIRMDTVFGDSSQESSGIFGSLVGAGKRIITGVGLFTTVFTNHGNTKAKVAFAAPFPGKIFPLELSKYGGEYICQKDSFLCAAKGVALDFALQKKMGAGFFGGEGFILQRLKGDGLAFIHAGGTLIEKELKQGETLTVDPGCVVGFEKTIDFDIKYVGSIKSVMFGGEGIFFAHVRGPGKVIVQSLPISRLAGRILANAPIVNNPSQ